MKKLKRSIYIFSAVFLVLPFLLLTDLFPFLRFAMFAEPVTYTPQSELFFVTYTDSTGKELRFDPEIYELQEETFQYLSRNYYYRSQCYSMLEKLKVSGKLRTDSWKFYKVSFDRKRPEKKDTVQICSVE
jgi:hypothetical protein